MIVEIGRRLRELRESRHLSQGDLEARTGLLHKPRRDRAHCSRRRHHRKIRERFGNTTVCIFLNRCKSARSGTTANSPKVRLGCDAERAISKPQDRLGSDKDGRSRQAPRSRTRSTIDKSRTSEATQTHISCRLIHQSKCTLPGSTVEALAPWRPCRW